MIGIHPKAILDIGQVPASLRDEITAARAATRRIKQFFIEAGRRRGHHRRGLLSETRDRADVRLQVERVPQAARRRDLRAGGRTRCSASVVPRATSRTACDCFEMEVAAMKKVRNELGLTNVQIAIPFVRNLEEAGGGGPARRAWPQARRQRPQADLMCEIPSNAILAEQFLQSISTATRSAPTT